MALVGRSSRKESLEIPHRAGSARATGRVRVSEGVAYGVTAILSAVLAFVRAPIYTHWFEPAAYGEFSLVSAAAGLLSSIILAVFSNVLYRHYDRERRAGRLDAFLATLAGGTAGSLALLSVAALAAGRWLGLESSSAAVWVIVLTGIATFQALVSQVNRMEHQVAAFVVAKLVDPVWQLAAPLLFFAFGLGGFPALVSTAAVAGAGSLLVAGAWASPIIRRTNLRKAEAKALKAAVGYGLPLIPLALAGWMIASSNRYVIQHFLGSEATGVFSMGYTLASVPLGLFSGPLVMTIGPVVWERLNLQGSAQALGLVRRASSFFLALALPSALGLGLLADRIVEVLFSAAYAETVSVILPISLGSVFAGLQSFLVKPWELHESTRSVPVYVGVGALTNLGVNLWLVPRLGIVGAAWGSLAAYTVVAGLMVLVAQRKYRVWLLPGWRDTLSVAGACGVMALGLMMLRLMLPLPGAWGLTTLILAGAIAYTATLIALGSVLKCQLIKDLKKAGFGSVLKAFGRVFAHTQGRLV